MEKSKKTDLAITNTGRQTHNRKIILMGIVAFVLSGAIAVLSGLLEKAGPLVALIAVVLVTLLFLAGLPQHSDK